MAKLETLKCSNCGGPIGLDQLDKCPYCGGQNFIKSEVDPLRIDGTRMSEYINFFKKKSDDNPKDTNALFAMGLFYLRLQNYELAQRNFKQAVDLSPMEPDMYYYYALSLIAGRSPKNIEHDEARRIEEWIETAIKMQRKRKYLALMAFVAQGAFVSNGLQSKEQPAELVKEACSIAPEGGELEEIEEHVRLTDPKNQLFFSKLRGGSTIDDSGLYRKKYNMRAYVCPLCGKQGVLSRNDDGSYSCSNCNNLFSKPPYGRLDACVCYFPSSRDYGLHEKEDKITALASVAERRNFFENLWEPNEPEVLSLPRWPIGKLVKGLITMLVLTFIFSWIAGCSGRIFNAYEIADHGVGKTRKERQAIQEAQQNDSLVLTTDLILIYGYKTIDAEGKRSDLVWGRPDETVQRPFEIKYVERSKETLFWFLLMLSPLLVFLICQTVYFAKCSNSRKRTKRRNAANRQAYEDALDRFYNRPTVNDYVNFCARFLGKKGFDGIGDPVTKTLQDLNIDERDVAGKIYLLNFFRCIDNDDNLILDPEQVLNAIYYTIVIPQRDKVTFVEKRWNTLTNDLDGYDKETVFYKNISGIKEQSDWIRFKFVGGTERKIASQWRANVLHYQSESPQDIYSYSITRTGDQQEFLQAIEKLVAAYQK